MANSLIEGMRSGVKKAFVDGLAHSGAIYRMNAIGFYVKAGVFDEEIIDKIKELKQDEVALDGYSVADFAKAALDLMGIERYCGESLFVKKLIASKFDFLE